MTFIPKILLQALSFLLCLTSAYPGFTQAIPKHLQKSFQEDATLQVSHAVKIFMTAKKEFEKKGAAAFIESFNKNAPGAFTESEQKFLIQKAAKIVVLPDLVIKGNALVGLEGNKNIFSLNTMDVAQGKFYFPEQSLMFNYNKRVVENYLDWTKLESSSLDSYKFYSLLQLIESFFIPQALAKKKKSTGTYVLIGALLGGLAGAFLLPKVMAYFKGEKESDYMPSPSTHTPNTAAIQAPLAPPPAPAASTATQASGLATVASEGLDGGPKEEPDAKSPEDKKKTDDQLAAEYIATLNTDDSFKSLEKFLEAKKSNAKFPNLACDTLASFLNDLKTKKEPLKNEVVNKAFELLTKTDDGKEVPVTLNNAPIKVKLLTLTGGTSEEDCSKVRDALKEEILKLNKTT